MQWSERSGFVTAFRSATSFDLDGMEPDVGSCDCALFASRIEGEFVRARQDGGDYRRQRA
jgi:hypothetical protein